MIGLLLCLNAAARAQVDLSRSDIVSLKTSTEAVTRPFRSFAPAVPPASQEAVRKSRRVPRSPGASVSAEPTYGRLVVDTTASAKTGVTVLTWPPPTPEESEAAAEDFARVLAIEAGLSDSKGAALEREAKAIRALLGQVQGRYPEFRLERRGRSSISCSVLPKPFTEEEKRRFAALPRETPVRLEFRRCLKAVAAEVGAEEDSFIANYFKLGFRDAKKVEALFGACPDVQGASCGLGGSWGGPQDYVDMRRTGHEVYALSFHHCVECGDIVSRWRTKTLKVQYDVKGGRFSFGTLEEEPESP